MATNPLEDRDLNPTIKVTQNEFSMNGLGNGTLGARSGGSEDVQVIDVADIGKSMAAPDLSATDWSAGNPFDAPSFNDLRPN